ncbi:hypothetical protein DPSP01_008188 [Paraphaeosphaeria sporulosa]|uniref:Uncharacterized protein n=1 Tax=Paraphaeosphaeria sporulosa TaxID=1460663 RepID=A0A177C7J3_9PLEO|nr:uncharacterized protein CC84DRAFT_1178281 [Paraphaeosphaeria sporulosa]OAG02670.1 hypothetical protein CC84DRAFT_1178281 [Paraphaeosphaeria sporulosa]
MPGVAGSPIPGKAACTGWCLDGLSSQAAARPSSRPFSVKALQRPALADARALDKDSGKRVQFVPGCGDERGVTLLLAGGTWAPLSCAACRCRARGRRPHPHAASAWSKRGRVSCPLPVTQHRRERLGARAAAVERLPLSAVLLVASMGRHSRRTTLAPARA